MPPPTKQCTRSGGAQDSTIGVGLGGNGTAAPIPPRLPGGLVAADITGLLSTVPQQFGLRVTREYGAVADGNGFTLTYNVSNAGNATLELGAFASSLTFNQDWTGLSLPQTAASCSLFDPYMGLDGGYVRVARISGTGPVMLVTSGAPTVCTPVRWGEG